MKIDVAPTDDAVECRHEHVYGPLARVFRALIVFYQRVTDGRPSPCRFTPTCSSYALEAISTHGAGRGSWLAVRRLARCHPLGGHGFDPVPLPKG